VTVKGGGDPAMKSGLQNSREVAPVSCIGWWAVQPRVSDTHEIKRKPGTGARRGRSSHPQLEKPSSSCSHTRGVTHSTTAFLQDPSKYFVSVQTL